MKPYDRIVRSLTKLIEDAKDAESNFNNILAKRGLAAAIERHGEWVQTSALAAQDATDMLGQLNGLTVEAHQAKMTELVNWYIGQIVRNRGDRPERLIQLAAHKLGYEALTNLLC